MSGEGVTFSTINVTPLTFALVNTKTNTTLCAGRFVGALFTDDLVWICITVLAS